MSNDFFQGGRGSGPSGVGGVFNGSSVTISLGSASGQGLPGALVQQVQIRYQRQINRINEIGSYWVYYSVGQTSGSGELQNILGPSPLIQQMVSELADICNAPSTNLELSAQQDFCGTGQGPLEGGSGSLSITIEGPVLTSIGVSMSVQDLLIMSNMGFEFAGMSGSM